MEIPPPPPHQPTNPQHPSKPTEENFSLEPWKVEHLPKATFPTEEEKQQLLQRLPTLQETGGVIFNQVLAFIKKII